MLTGNNKRGFTLIELLVVIGIIGILGYTISAALNTARAKARDGKRIAELREIRSALNLYYATNQTYPSSTPAGFSGDDAAIQFLVAQTPPLLSKLPVPPPGASATYIYRGVESSDGSECTDDHCDSFALGATLELATSSVYNDDNDQVVGSVFFGGSEDCAAGPTGSDERCFDLRP
jgi:prepilin-type N-terminal cleavage/methylation domain-containing protein